MQLKTKKILTAKTVILSIITVINYHYYCYYIKNFLSSLALFF